MNCISLHQPWPWAIFAPIPEAKNVENRSWSPSFRGRILIHASKTCTDAEFGDSCAWIYDRFGVEVPPLDELARGAIVGAVTVVDVVQRSSSKWFVGPFGLVLENPVALRTPVPCRGMQGIFRVPDEVAEQVRKAAA